MLERIVSAGCLGLAVVALAPRATVAQSTLSGFVRSALSSAPIDGATLLLDGEGTARSQSDGRYRFDGVARGTHVVTVRAVGYKERVDTILVDASAAETRHDFRLDRIAALDSVVTTAAQRKYISPGLKGFEERRAAGFGHFVTDSVFRREESEALSSILETHVTGMRIIHYEGEDYAVTTHHEINNSTVSSRGRGATAASRFTGLDGRAYPDECYVTIFVDGTLRYDKAMQRKAPPIALGSFVISDLGGIEYYAGSSGMPMQFQSKSACGSLVIWTRER
jgi:Carboxypeptidase regulatory-like domain